MSGDAYQCDLKLVDAIEASLKDRDERGAQIAETHNDEHAKDSGRDYKNCGLAIAEIIRKQ